jgi:hypothetical protein
MTIDCISIQCFNFYISQCPVENCQSTNLTLEKIAHPGFQKEVFWSGHSFQICSVAAMRLKVCIDLFFTKLSQLHCFFKIRARSTGSLVILPGYKFSTASRRQIGEKKYDNILFLILISYI